MKMKLYEKYLNESFSYGDSRFAYEEEITEDAFECTLDKSEKGGIPLVAKAGRVFVDSGDNHSIIFGSSGSMKTRRLIMPLINYLISSGENLFVADPKGELFNRTSGIAEKMGYRIFILNLRNPKASHRWNPLGTPWKLYRSGEKEAAINMINDFIEIVADEQRNSRADPFWHETAANLLLANILLMFETCSSRSKVNINSLAKMCSLESAETLIKIASKLPLNCLASINYGCLFSASEKTLCSIMISAFAMINRFITSPNLSSLMSSVGINFDEIPYKKTIIYMITPDESTRYNFVVSMFVQQLYQYLISATEKTDNGKLPIRFNFVLDEFCNIPPLCQVGTMLTSARSRDIRFYLVVQSLRQFYSKYGEDDAQTIISNCANLFYLSGRETELVKNLSDLCGTQTDSSGIHLPIISPSELMRFSKTKGEMLLLHGRCYPFVTELPDIEEYQFPLFPPVAMSVKGKMPMPMVLNTAALLRDIEEGCIPIPFLND